MTEILSPAAASAAVEQLGWRYLLGALTTAVAVPSYDAAVAVVAGAVAACGPAAADHLRLDLRPAVVELTVQSPDGEVTGRDVELAHGLTDAVRDLGLQTTPGAGTRRVQALEIAIDALDIAGIRPFWKAVLGYVDEPGRDGPADPIVDPHRQGPAVWFQQLDVPRVQRNRIHLDATVPHDEADARIAAALAAGGRLLSDAAARSFWILADAEGNEVCVCTWQDRD